MALRAVIADPCTRPIFSMHQITRGLVKVQIVELLPEVSDSVDEGGQQEYVLPSGRSMLLRWSRNYTFGRPLI